MAPNAYQAGFVADHHDAEQVALTRAVVVGICAESQSATHAMGMMGIRSLPMDERPEVNTGWGMFTTITSNSIWALQAIRERRPTSRCAACATRRLLQKGRLTALFFSLDCRPNCMEARAKPKYRDEHHAPLPGAAGDLARSCDEQFLDAFVAIKRILDERAVLVERNAHGLEREETHEDAYGASTDGEDDDAEPTEQTNGATGDEAEAPNEDYPSDDDASAPPAAISGGDDCEQFSDQQGHVLPVGHPPDLLCVTEGCNRHRRRYADTSSLDLRGTAGGCQTAAAMTVS